MIIHFIFQFVFVAQGGLLGELRPTCSRDGGGRGKCLLAQDDVTVVPPGSILSIFVEFIESVERTEQALGDPGAVRVERLGWRWCLTRRHEDTKLYGWRGCTGGEGGQVQYVAQTFLSVALVRCRLTAVGLMRRARRARPYLLY